MTNTGYQDTGGSSSTNPGINPSRRRFLSIAALTTAAAGTGFTAHARAHGQEGDSSETFQPSGPLDTSRALPCDEAYAVKANSGDIAQLQHEPISFPPDFRDWDADELQASGWLH